MSKRWMTAAVGAALGVGIATPAAAGSFDGTGRYVAAGDAVAFVDFGSDFDPEEDHFIPDDVPADCIGLVDSYAIVDGADALSGGSYAQVETDIIHGCSERFLVDLPKEKASYRATLWMRHGSIDAQMTVTFPADSGREIVVAKMGPTGRVTSDGWVELASNAFPVDGEAAEAIYLRVYDYDDEGSEIDALEIRPADEPYVPETACSGIGDPVCGDEGVCMYNQCRLGRLYVPPLPEDPIRDQMVDMMQSRLRVFFGGRKTRQLNLPQALDQLQSIRTAETAWQFWNGWGKAWRLLHDWHTRASASIDGVRGDKRLNVCFIQGDADASQKVWTKHPVFKDILVSHAGSDGAQGIAQGDRLVAVDGLHPAVWALTLRDVDWGWWQASDDDVYAELAERMRGLILRYASTFTVIHCDKSTGACQDVAETYVVADLPTDTGGQVRCDNRPYYHMADSPGESHNVGYKFFSGPILEATPQQAVYGLVWDTLYGGGDPNSYVNSNISSAYDTFRQNARGVILDHRAGNGGTLDAAELVTTLVRPPSQALVFTSPTELGSWDGPENPLQGMSVFNEFKNVAAMNVGASDYDPDMPVALIIHRDGSASDFMPYGMKGAPKTQIFGPGPTAGAFSTFYELEYWAGISFRMASGDSIGSDGATLIGHGVEPDVMVQQKQSDLLAGKDTIHEAALAWVLANLKP